MSSGNGNKPELSTPEELRAVLVDAMRPYVKSWLDETFGGLFCAGLALAGAWLEWGLGIGLLAAVLAVLLWRLACRGE